jgi:hypothetical protein
MLAENHFFVAARAPRFARLAAGAVRDFATRLAFTARFFAAAFFAFVGVSIAGRVTLGNDFGRLFCTIVTAVSAACRTVDWTVVRACLHSELAVAKEFSRRSPTRRIVRDSGVLP